MIDWFLGLPMEDRLLLGVVFLSFVFLIFPGVKINFRNIIKAIIVVIAAFLLYTLYTGETPTALFNEVAQPPPQEKAPLSVPNYYEDPEKRWQENR